MGRVIGSRNSREIRNKDGQVIVVVAGIATEVHEMRSRDTQKFLSISQSIKFSQSGVPHTEQSDKHIPACLHPIHIQLHLWSAIFKKAHMHIVPCKNIFVKKHL